MPSKVPRHMGTPASAACVPIGHRNLEEIAQRFSPEKRRNDRTAFDKPLFLVSGDTKSIEVHPLQGGDAFTCSAGIGTLAFLHKAPQGRWAGKIVSLTTAHALALNDKLYAPVGRFHSTEEVEIGFVAQLAPQVDTALIVITFDPERCLLDTVFLLGRVQGVANIDAYFGASGEGRAVPFTFIGTWYSDEFADLEFPSGGQSEPMVPGTAGLIVGTPAHAAGTPELVFIESLFGSSIQIQLNFGYGRLPPEEKELLARLRGTSILIY
eukprot:m51a1_g13763 hypothetical protein (267) ;mRNA; f:244831-246262